VKIRQIAALACLAGICLAQTSVRYNELKRVVDRNTGFAHATRGMNMFTLYAVRSCVTDKDLPVLGQLLTDKDRITRMTAANVLMDFGDSGKAVVEKRLKEVAGRDVSERLMLEDVLSELSAKTRKPILDYPLTERERAAIRGCQ
jgi:hypothetical protein